MCLGSILTALQSPKFPIFKQQKKGIYWFLSSGTKICFGIRPSNYVLKGCYDDTTLKSTHKYDFLGECVPPLPPTRAELLFWNVVPQRVHEV